MSSKLLALLLFATAVSAQAPADGAREAMWPAPTAQDWARPCLIDWQRSFDDALAVSEATNRPILVCVNMDGEIASEHYAGIRYRQPEIAALYEPYVCVIASVYRHTPRDYDQHGRRIPCPRFGTVTCGEHIALEPLVYERFLDGVRVAPRHIMVELDRSEVYDVYYAFDTQSVFDTIERGMAERDMPVSDLPRDRSLLERVTSADSHDRSAVERAYLEGDRPTRVAILERAIQAGANAPVDVLRLAIRDVDVELSQLARRALLEATTEGSIDLIARALRTPMPKEDRDALIGALDRLGKTFPRAATLAVVFRGLAADAGTVDVRTLSRALLEAGEPRFDRASTATRLTELERELGRGFDRESAADDPESRLALAEATLALARARAAEREAATAGASAFAKLSLEDVRRQALEAERLGAYGWRANAAIAIAEYRLGNLDEAYRRAETAVRAMPEDASVAHAAEVLAIFGEARRMAITRSVQAEEEWPAEWLNDVGDAYAFLLEHPFGTEHHVLAHHDFLRWLGAHRRADEVLGAALVRFPDAADLHDRLRTQILREHGALGLEAHYERWLEEGTGTPSLRWFAGYASMVTAEYHRRQGERGASNAAYGRAIDHFEAWAVSTAGDESVAEEPVREHADHFVAMAFAGRGRNALDDGDLERAWSELQRSYERRTSSAANLDGLGFSCVATTQMLASRAARTGLDDLAQAVLAKLA
ncbi:MAG: hypothetical protein WD226_02370, partial [Planctomycetota bacterium]